MRTRIRIGGDNHRAPFLNLPADLAASVQVPTIRRQCPWKRGLTLWVSLLFAASLAFPQEFSAPRNISNNHYSIIPVVATDPARGYVYVLSLGTPTYGPYGLWLMRSTDGGATFSTPMEIGAPNGFEPSMKVDSNGTIWITWSEQTVIGVMRSDDHGSTFATLGPLPVEDLSNVHPPLFVARRNPDIAADSQGVTVVWQSVIGPGVNGDANADIFVTRSTNRGATFSPPINVSNDLVYSADPRVATGSGGSIHIAWGDPNSGPVRYVRSLDGSTFSSPQDIIGADKLSRRPRIAINRAGTIAVVSEGTVFVVSADNGNSFTQAQTIGGLGHEWPDVAMEPNGTIDVVAQVYESGGFPTPLTFASSQDGGATFRTLMFANTQGDININGGVQETGIPRIAVGLGIYIVWYDYTNPSFDTFYTTGSVAELLDPNGGTNIYPFADNLFNYKVTYPAFVSPGSPVYLAVAPTLISQADLTARLAESGFAGAQLAVYDGTGGYGVLFRAACQDPSGNPVDCPQTTGPYDVYTSWNTPSGGPDISNPAFLTAEIAPVGTQTWSNIFTAYSATRIDPTGSGRTCCHFSDFVFVGLVAGASGTAPSITITAPQNGATYALNEPVPASYSCTPSPPVVACLGDVPNRSNVDTSSVGSKTFTVNATVSSGLAAVQTVNYQVLASTPVAGVSPSSIDFGTVYLGTITFMPVTVTNQGNAPMTISNPLLSLLSGGNSKEFVAQNFCPRWLAAGRSCKIVVSFLAGPYYTPQTALLRVMDNAPGAPQTVALSATVINPQALLSACSLSFGTQQVNTSTAAKSVTLKNPGATALTITGIAIVGANPQDFMQTNNCPLSPASLAPNGACTISVTFKPTARGLRSGSVVITDNAQSSPQKMLLSGRGN